MPGHLLEDQLSGRGKGRFSSLLASVERPSGLALSNVRVRWVFLNNDDNGDDACQCLELQLSHFLVKRFRVIGGAEGGPGSPKKERRAQPGAGQWQSWALHCLILPSPGNL